MEVDRYWAELSEGGKPGPCGWLKDRFGVSWQIVPNSIVDWMKVALFNGSTFGSTSTEWFSNWSTTYDYKLADVNGDGRVDIVGRNYTSGQVVVGLSDGSTFGSHGTEWHPNWSTAYDYKLADVNGDGRVDLVGRNLSSGNVQVALSSASTFGNTSTEWFPNWSTAYDYQLADVNGDRTADIVGRNYTLGQLLVGLSKYARYYLTNEAYGTYLVSNLRYLTTAGHWLIYTSLTNFSDGSQDFFPIIQWGTRPEFTGYFTMDSYRTRNYLRYGMDDPASDGRQRVYQDTNNPSLLLFY